MKVSKYINPNIIQDGSIDGDKKIKNGSIDGDKKIKDYPPLKKGRGENSVCQNSCTATGDYSHAEGYYTKATGGDSHAEGLRTTAAGYHSHAEGSDTLASGFESHAEGSNTKAKGDDSHAEGDFTLAQESNSHAEGSYTIASGKASHAEGHWTKANGNYSHAEGNHTISNYNGSHAEGRYNYANIYHWIHTVGIGNSEEDRKNAHLILDDGKHYIIGIGGYEGKGAVHGGSLQEVVNGKQDKLTAGAGLTIDDNNTISINFDPNIFKVVSVLPEIPAEGDDRKIHLVPSDESEDGNAYNEYIYVDSSWEKIGSFRPSIDLSDFIDLTSEQTITAAKTFSGGVSMNNTRIKKVGSPVNTDDAANKEYVDTQITEVGEGMTAMQEAFNSAYEALGTEINSLTEKTTALETKTSKIESDVVKYSGLYFYNLFGSKTSSEIKSSLYYPGYYPEDEEIDDLTYYTGLISYLRHTFNTKHLNTVQFYAVEDMTEEQYKYYGYFSDKETPEIILYNTWGKSYDFIKITCLESTDDEGHPNGYILDSVSTFSFPMEVIKNKVTSLEAKNTELVNTITELEPIVANAVQITYAELKALRDAGKLIPGTQYRITDYTCTTTQTNTKSAGHIFDIIVTADDASTLNEVARAVKHEGDTYFANSNLSAWKIWYCLDNDTNKFVWADATNGKGVIYRMIDEWNNDCPYDFKNMMFKVYYDDDFGAYKVGAEDNSEWSYTFCMLDRYDNKAHDVSVEQYKYIGDEGFCYHTYDNRMLPYYDDYAIPADDEIEGSIAHGSYVLNANVFVTDTDICSVEEDYSYSEFYAYCNNVFGNDCYDNVFGNDCYDNAFGNDCYNNAFGNGCDYNSFGNGCYGNAFGNGCNYNAFGNDCNYNAFGNDCYNNAFGNDCDSNSFGNDCYNNAFGNGCDYNSFGNDCYNNAFGNGCNSNSFGNDCYGNAFGNSCNYNAFGNDCDGNIFGNYCYSNTFGDACNSNTFGNDCKYINFVSDKTATTRHNYYQYNHFGDGCQYILFKGAETASSSTQVQNYNFAQGLKGTARAFLTIDGVRNRAYETKVAKNSKREVKIYCEADLIL